MCKIFTMYFKNLIFRCLPTDIPVGNWWNISQAFEYSALDVAISGSTFYQFGVQSIKIRTGNNKKLNYLIFFKN